MVAEIRRKSREKAHKRERSGVAGLHSGSIALHFSDLRIYSGHIFVAGLQVQLSD